MCQREEGRELPNQVDPRSNSENAMERWAGDVRIKESPCIDRRHSRSPEDSSSIRRRKGRVDSEAVMKAGRDGLQKGLPLQ